MVALKKISDQQLAISYAQGHENSLNELLKRHEQRLIKYVYYIVRDADVANDIFQETFFRFIKAVKSGAYKEDGKFSTFITTIAYHLAMDHLRNLKKMPCSRNTDEYNIFSNLKVHQTNVMDNIAKKESFAVLKLVYDKLPSKHQEILHLRFKQNLSFKEIAELKKTSINTSLGQFRYAIQCLQKLIKKYNIEADIY